MVRGGDQLKGRKRDADYVRVRSKVLMGERKPRPAVQDAWRTGGGLGQSPVLRVLPGGGGGDPLRAEGHEGEPELR